MIIIQKLINLKRSIEKERDKKEKINIPFLVEDLGIDGLCLSVLHLFLLNQLNQIHEWAWCCFKIIHSTKISSPNSLYLLTSPQSVQNIFRFTSTEMAHRILNDCTLQEVFFCRQRIGARLPHKMFYLPCTFSFHMHLQNN